MLSKPSIKSCWPKKTPPHLVPTWRISNRASRCTLRSRLACRSPPFSQTGRCLLYGGWVPAFCLGSVAPYGPFGRPKPCLKPRFLTATQQCHPQDKSAILSNWRTIPIAPTSVPTVGQSGFFPLLISALNSPSCLSQHASHIATVRSGAEFAFSALDVSTVHPVFPGLPHG